MTQCVLRHICFLLLSVSFWPPVHGAVRSNPRIDSLMMELDTVLANRGYYLAIKENRIDSLKGDLRRSSNDGDRFEVLGRLIEEYNPFNTDSAYAMSVCREEVARRMGNRDLIVNAILNRANILSATGMYNEAIELMKPISSSNVPSYLVPYYYHIKRTLYGRLADYAAFSDDRRDYERLTDLYRDSLMIVNEPGSLSHAISMADQLNRHGKPREALGVMREYMGSKQLPVHENALCAWTLSESYGLLGDTVSQKEYLLQSAISDMKAAVREYVSLRELALLLYREGDLDRAYDFMTIAVDDATKCNARHRIIELNESYPLINGIYVNTVNSQKKTLYWALAIISVLALFLLAAIWFLRKQMKRIANARKTIEEANLRLNQLNRQLQESNRELCEANHSIAENSKVKTTYIGRYMDQCMEYIEKLDSYRKSIAKLAATGKNEELKKMAKSSAAIDDELKSFYDNFDSTFLKLFPTFVEDFNKLLMPDEAIIPKKAGSLTTELRIFALIRLGISDSDRIAKFLRYSLTTIYNYRTRVRNKAVGDRSKLDEQVLMIGRADM